MVKVLLILILMAQGGEARRYESVWYSFEDCTEAGERLHDYFADSEFVFSCEYFPPRP